MEINVRFLDKLRLEAKFDDFTITTDQPIRYKGDGSAPSPFDYFLASSALCAAYFVKVYCLARNIPTDDIRISQSNHIDPENRYQQTFEIKVQLPESISPKHRKGILMAMERCTVKKVIQTGPDFDIKEFFAESEDLGLHFTASEVQGSETRILGKDAPLEETLKRMTAAIAELGIKLEIASWRNIVSNVWSVHIRDADSPMCFTNGKGTTKESALCSALGEYIERISCNYFYNDFYLGQEVANEDFVHYPDERWFIGDDEGPVPEGLMDDYMKSIYDPIGELRFFHLWDTNSGTPERGICAQPFIRQSDKETVYVPVGLVGNLYVSNGMSAGNSTYEARVQCLSEIFERAVKKEIIEQEICLPDVPKDVLAQYPSIETGIKELEAKGFPVQIKDASLGGRYPVMCVSLMNPKTGGVYASFGAHPKFEVALERSLTELLQGRSFDGLNDMPAPSFNSLSVTEPNNFVEHFVDSTGIVSWRFFASKSQYDFHHWNIDGDTKAEHDYLLSILAEMEKEVYIADYDDFGAKACRILVPGYSEIYPVEDLVWDNTNKALFFRDDILQLHQLDNDELEDLADKLEESELDQYTLISELIGIAFDENSSWGQLDIGELKSLIFLALGRLDEAKELVERFLSFNESSTERQRFYQGLHGVLEIYLQEDLSIDNYRESFGQMFGQEKLQQMIAAVEGTERFPGLAEIGLDLKGQEKHLRLIESYQKLHRARRQKSR